MRLQMAACALLFGVFVAMLIWAPETWPLDVDPTWVLAAAQ